MKRCNKCEEWHVIDSTCPECKKLEKAEFEALMGGNLAEMKPVRNYTDNPGMFDNALISHGGDV